MVTFGPVALRIRKTRAEVTWHLPNTIIGAALLSGEAQDSAMLGLRATQLAADPLGGGVLLEPC